MRSYIRFIFFHIKPCRHFSSLGFLRCLEPPSHPHYTNLFYSSECTASNALLISCTGQADQRRLLAQKVTALLRVCGSARYSRAMRITLSPSGSALVAELSLVTRQPSGARIRGGCSESKKRKALHVVLSLASTQLEKICGYKCDLRFERGLQCLLWQPEAIIPH